MFFQLSEEQRILKHSLRKYLDSKVEPVLRDNGEKHFSRETMQGFLKTLGKFGLGTAPHPKKWGGFGTDWLTHLIVFEEVVYTSLDLAIPGFVNAIAVEMIRQCGSDELKEKYLPETLSGELFASLGVSEPEVGSDVSAVRTRASLKDGDWVINGEKTWVSNGDYSDFHICTCRTGDDEISHILVDRHLHGYDTVNIEKIALNMQSTAQLFLSDVRVPENYILGKRGDGLKNTLKIFEIARCHMAVWGIGIARRAMDEAIHYSQERVQHGKRIAGHQLVAQKLADMATNIDAARLLVYRAIDMVQRGERAEKECSMAKVFGTEMAVTATRDALQIHGSNGVSRGFLVERLVREAIINPIPDGTTEIQKLIIARALTGIQAFR
jgi:alkylation response protein AidB-like acyl-CoA dehydrogenase